MITLDVALDAIQAFLNVCLIVCVILMFRQQRKMKGMYDQHNKLYKRYQNLVVQLQVKTLELLGKQSDDA